MQADKSLLDHMTDLMAQYATRAEKTAKKVQTDDGWPASQENQIVSWSKGRRQEQEGQEGGEEDDKAPPLMRPKAPGYIDLTETGPSVHPRSLTRAGSCTKQIRQSRPPRPGA